MGSSRANDCHRGWGPLTRALWRARGLHGAWGGGGVPCVCMDGVFKVSRTVDLPLLAASPTVLARRAPVGLGLMAHISGCPVVTLPCPVTTPKAEAVFPDLRYRRLFVVFLVV